MKRRCHPGYTLSLISDFQIRAWNFVFIFHRVQAERLGKFLDYPKFCLLGLGQTPNFSWDTKLGELRSWSLLSSSEFVCLVRPTRSIRLKQTDRTSDDRLGDKRRSSHVTNQTNKLKNLFDNVYLASFRRTFFLKLLYGLIQLIGSTRPKFDVWPNKRS